uniref:Uncharacterized protein n=1 Tax=Avena sativa TaxID=4498 RepID=A0ACD5ZE90_AVESA
MSPRPLPPRPPQPRRLTFDSSPSASASKRQLAFLLPGTAPAPSTARHPGSVGGGITMEQIMEVIRSIRSAVRGETGATDARVRVPSKRRLDTSTPCTAVPSAAKRRLDNPTPCTAAPSATKRRLNTPTPCTAAPSAATKRRRLDDYHPCTATPKIRRRLLTNSPCTSSPKSRRRRAVHPVEVIGRIRNLTADASALDIGGTSVRVRSRDAGGGRPCLRDFTLDGVSASDEEGLEAFYGRFVRPRVQGVRAGANCTVMLYGPTGSGKSHTMFGTAEEPGIVYRALLDIQDGAGGNGGEHVQLSFLEIYNEQVRLEVIGTKARNATYISENDAGKIAREVVELVKRRAVKTTSCNARSSRSHCMIIVDVPAVGGRLMLVDMAGSENVEAAGQTGNVAKSETGNINQGNTTLKRVVESIANGDSHVPFRDSKLTMLLRDSFEDERSKILMTLCASPDPKELHKTISTLEYGARAKSITHHATRTSTPMDKMCSKEKEAQQSIRLKDDELARLTAKLTLVEAREAAANAEAIRDAEEAQFLWGELRKMKEKMLMQQQELLAVKQRLQEVEREKLDIYEQNPSPSLPGTS